MKLTGKFLVLIFSITFFAGAGAYAAEENAVPEDLYKELDVFSKALNYIDTEYVGDVDYKDLIYGAVRGMLYDLDPHSSFLSPDDYKEMKLGTKGSFGGIGIEIVVKDEILTVVTPIEGTPAEKAGIKAGDQVLAVDGVSTRGLTVSESIKMMRGNKGTKITLTIKRDGGDPFLVKLKRDTVRIKSVRWEELEPGYGYVRITTFQENTHKELEKALKKLVSQNHGKLKGLILDLRNNPGGLFDEAVMVADEFLEEGMIVSSVSRDKEVDRRMAVKEGTFDNCPMIILVNGGSASAAEIVAGAVQDHKRAVILGTRTFGKGSVQALFDLEDGSAIKLTVALYYTPNGRSIQAEGIKPDIYAETQPGVEAKQKRYLREKDLKGHLKEEREGEDEDDPASLKGKDYQKGVALDYLKSWEVFGSF